MCAHIKACFKGCIQIDEYTWRITKREDWDNKKYKISK